MPALFALGTGAAKAYSQIKREERALTAEKDKEKRQLQDSISLLRERVSIEDELTRKKEEERVGRLWTTVSKSFNIPAAYDEELKQQFMTLDDTTRTKITQGALLGGIRMKDTFRSTMDTPEAPEMGVMGRGPLSLADAFEVIDKEKGIDSPSKFVAAALIKFRDAEAKGIDPRTVLTRAELSLVAKEMNVDEAAGVIFKQAHDTYRAYLQNIMVDPAKKKDFGAWLESDPYYKQYKPQMDAYVKNTLEPMGIGYAQLASVEPVVIRNPREVVEPPPREDLMEGPPDVGPPTPSADPYAVDYRTGQPVVGDASGSTEVRRPEGPRSERFFEGPTPMRPKLFDLSPSKTLEEREGPITTPKPKEAKAAPIEERLTSLGIQGEAQQRVIQEAATFKAAPKETQEVMKGEFKKAIQVYKEANDMAGLNVLRAYLIAFNLNPKEFGL